MRRIMILYMRGRKTAPFMARMRFDRSVFRFGKPRALARGASLILAIILIPLVLTFAEEMTITTYYPSPNGAYDAMNVKRLSVGDTNGDGNINASDVSSSNGYLLVADRVGIGTRSPVTGLGFGGRQLITFNQDTGSETIGNIIGGMGFYGYGVSHGQFNYRAGVGFEMLNVSSDSPSVYHAATAYAPLYLSSLFASSTIGNRGGDIGQQMEQGSTALTTLRFDSDAYRVYAGGTSGLGELIRVMEGGNVGFGTTNPGAKIDIREDGTNPGLRLQYGGTNLYATIMGPVNRILRIDLPANGTDDGFLIRGSQDSGSTYPNNVLFASAGGKVGIGITNPSSQLHIYDSTVGNYTDNALKVETPYGYATFGSLTSSWFHISTSLPKFYFNNPCQAYGGFSTYSSREKKRDIVHLSALEEDAILDSLSGMRMAKFRYKDERFSKKVHLGIIAEESPDQLLTDSKKAIEIVDYISYAVTAIKAQQRQIKVQRSQIEELQKEIRALRVKSVSRVK